MNLGCNSIGFALGRTAIEINQKQRKLRDGRSAYSSSDRYDVYFSRVLVLGFVLDEDEDASPCEAVALAA